MKIFKKITTLLMLALALVIVIPVNALAETLTPTTSKYATVTIKNVDTGYESATVNAYKIIDTNVSAGTPISPVYTWNAAVAPWVAAHATYKAYIDPATGAVTDQFTGDVAAFYDDLANAIGSKNALINGGVVLAPAASATNADADTDGNIKLDLIMGNYLIIVANGVNIYKPSAVNIVPEVVSGAWTVKDVTVTLKYETPSITKTVDATTVSADGIGNEVDFEITVTIPEYPENAIYKTVKVRDKFTPGLTYKKGSIEVKTVKVVDGTEVETVLDADAYELTEVATNDYDFMITFDTDAYNESLAGNKKLIATYKGIVNANAVVETAEVNKAVLEYSNDPYISDEHSTEDVSVVNVYTYGIKLTKVDEKNTSLHLAGAKFKVYADSAKNTLIKFVNTGDGTYRRAIENPIYAADGTTVLIPADAAADMVEEVIVGSGASNKGILELSGLADGATYYLEETAAPEGYVLVQKIIPVTITAKVVDGLKTKFVDDEDDQDGFAAIPVKNGTDIPVLPITGGIGTILFSVIGILFMGLGAFLIKNINKKEDAE